MFRSRSGKSSGSAGSHPRQAGDADVRGCCRQAGIPVLTVDSLDSRAALDAIAQLRPDLFVFAGGAILRAPLLAIPKLGTLNAHMGILSFIAG